MNQTNAARYVSIIGLLKKASPTINREFTDLSDKIHNFFNNAKPSDVMIVSAREMLVVEVVLMLGNLIHEASATPDKTH